MGVISMGLILDGSGCKPFDLPCKAAEKATEGMVHGFVKMLVEGCTDLLAKLIGIFFAVESTVDLAMLDAINSKIKWIVAAIIVISTLVAAGKLALSPNSSTAKTLGLSAMRLILVQAFAGLAVTVTLKFGDEISPILMREISGTAELTPETTAELALMLVGANAGGIMILLITLLTLLAALAQLLFLMIRDPIVVLLLAILPCLAAWTHTDDGMTAYKRTCAWLLGIALYKPLAALLFGTGLYLIKGGSGDDPINSAISGFMLVFLTAALLPVMVKLLMPMASVGQSNLASGGAAAVAVGAAALGAVKIGAMASAKGASSSAAGPAAGASPPAGPATGSPTGSPGSPTPGSPTPPAPPAPAAPTPPAPTPPAPTPAAPTPPAPTPPAPTPPTPAAPTPAAPTPAAKVIENAVSSTQLVSTAASHAAPHED